MFKKILALTFVILCLFVMVSCANNEAVSTVDPIETDTYQEALDLIEQEAFDQAIEALKGILDKDESNVEVILTLIELYMKTDMMDESVELANHSMSVLEGDQKEAFVESMLNLSVTDSIEEVNREVKVYTSESVSIDKKILKGRQSYDDLFDTGTHLLMTSTDYEGINFTALDYKGQVLWQKTHQPEVSVNSPYRYHVSTLGVFEDHFIVSGANITICDFEGNILMEKNLEDYFEFPVSRPHMNEVFEFGQGYIMSGTTDGMRLILYMTYEGEKIWSYVDDCGTNYSHQGYTVDELYYTAYGTDDDLSYYSFNEAGDMATIDMAVFEELRRQNYDENSHKGRCYRMPSEETSTFAYSYMYGTHFEGDSREFQTDSEYSNMLVIGDDIWIGTIYSIDPETELHVISFK